MIFFDAEVEPDDLTTFVREVPINAGRALLGLFPRRDVLSNEVNWAEITHTNRTAKFRAFDGRIHVSSRDTSSEKKVALPPLSTSYNMGEYERLQLEFARTGGTRQAALAAAIYDDATNGTNEILNRMEMAWGDVLTDGKFTLAGEGGLYLEADFGIPGANIVSAAVAWTTLSASALTELIAWHDAYITNGNGPAGQIRTSQRVIRLLTRNTEIINAIAGAAATRTMVSLTEVQNLFASVGLPPLGPAIDESLDVDGSTTRVIADDKLMFLPADQDMASLGYTAWGITATALELVRSNESELDFEQAPGIVGVVEKVGPPYRQFTFVDAVGMPVLIQPKRIMVADVI